MEEPETMQDMFKYVQYLALQCEKLRADVDVLKKAEAQRSCRIKRSSIDNHRLNPVPQFTFHEWSMDHIMVIPDACFEEVWEQDLLSGMKEFILSELVKYDKNIPIRCFSASGARAARAKSTNEGDSQKLSWSDERVCKSTLYIFENARAISHHKIAAVEATDADVEEGGQEKGDEQGDSSCCESGGGGGGGGGDDDDEDGQVAHQSVESSKEKNGKWRIMNPVEWHKWIERIETRFLQQYLARCEARDACGEGGTTTQHTPTTWSIQENKDREMAFMLKISGGKTSTSRRSMQLRKWIIAHIFLDLQ